jgi:hypothetical protein
MDAHTGTEAGLLSLLLDEGLSEAEADCELRDALRSCEQFLDGYTPRSRIVQLREQPKHASLAPWAVEGLPFLLARISDEDSKDLVEELAGARLEHPKHVHRFLRYAGAWSTLFAQEGRDDILRTFANRSNPYLPCYLGLYADVVDRIASGGLAQELHARAYSGGYLLSQLSALPLHRLSVRAQEAASPMLSLEGSLVTSSVRAVRHIDKPVGRCPEADNDYRKILFAPGNELYGECAIISCNGMPVGALKLENHPSLVALRTVQDADGTHPLVFGCIYGTHSDVVAAAREARERHGAWATADVNALGVFPLRPLFATGHWGASGNTRQLYAFADRLHAVREMHSSHP